MDNKKKQHFFLRTKKKGNAHSKWYFQSCYFLYSLPFLLFSGEDQGMTACTLCSIIINQETVWREWCQPPAETKPSWVVFLIIRKLGNIYIARPYSSHKGNTVFPAGLFLMNLKHLDSFFFLFFWVFILKYIPVDCTEVKRLNNNNLFIWWILSF